ncbi:MAG: molybdenum cofactor guanylyltransferase MobA [Pseudomonadota bacterium]
MSKRIHPPRVVGLLLAGGEGRRLGGRDKGMAPWRGRSMAAWVCDALAAVASPVLVSANRSLDDYRALAPAPGHVFEDDARIRGHGPLAGLLTGLRQARAHGAAAVLVCPCDTPEITSEVLARLVSAWQAAAESAVIAECAGRVHPLHGVYPVALIPVLERQLQQGNRKVMAFAEVAGVTKVACADAPTAFKNRNRPEDLNSN